MNSTIIKGLIEPRGSIPYTFKVLENLNYEKVKSVTREEKAVIRALSKENMRELRIAWRTKKSKTVERNLYKIFRATYYNPCSGLN